MYPRSKCTARSTWASASSSSHRPACLTIYLRPSVPSPPSASGSLGALKPTPPTFASEVSDGPPDSHRHHPSLPHGNQLSLAREIPRQGTRYLRPRRRPPASHHYGSAERLRSHARCDPIQGTSPQPDLAALVREDRAHRRQPRH